MDSPHPEDVGQHYAWVLSLLPTTAPVRVVDLGCGVGNDLAAMASRYSNPEARFLGVDASAGSVAQATRHLSSDRRVDVREMRLTEHLHFESAAFDLVFSNNLLECFGDPTAFAQEVGRILRPGGVAVMVHWDWDSQQFDGSDKDRIRRLVHAYADWQQGWMDHADGWMGRRLWGVFNATGLFEGAIHARVMTNTSFSPPYFGYARAQDMRGLAKRNMATSADVDGFLDEQATLSQQGRYFYSITGYAYVGKRLPS